MLSSRICPVARIGAASLALAAGCGPAAPTALPPFPAPEPQAALDLTLPEHTWPELGDAHPLRPGIRRHALHLMGDRPGTRGLLWIYVPEGPPPPGGRPAVLIPPAGTDVLVGKGLETLDTFEHLPYARAGFVVVAFELDGYDRGSEAGDYAGFVRVKAGLLNGVAALDFLKRRVPGVDHDRIFAVGHSSAGDAALLFAAHHPELAGVVVYNSSGDGCWYHDPGYLAHRHRWEAGFADFCQQTRARNHVHRLAMPALVFGSREDPLVSAAAVQHLADAIPTDVELHVADRGDHYDSMRKEGIPAGVAWLTRRMR